MPTHRKTTYLSKLLLTATALLLCLGEASAQRVTEYVTSDSLRVGDTFSYIFTLSKDRSYNEVLFPDSSHFGDAIEIRSRQRFRVTDFKDSLVYNLQFFGTEDTRIPPLPLTFIAGGDTSIAYTNPVPIRFKTTLQEEEEAFRPLKPIFDFARAWWPYIVGLILLGFLAWYLYRYYRERQVEAPEPKPKRSFQPTPFVDPIDRLENSLRQLRSFTFESDEDFKLFYINLGDAIRTYFEELYTIPALESTSREIIRALEQRMVDERMIDQTRKVLREADMVKFAKFRPTVDQTKESLKVAEEFLSVVREIDSSRVEYKRRQHLQKMEQQRREFEEEADRENDKPLEVERS